VLEAEEPKLLFSYMKDAIYNE